MTNSTDWVAGWPAADTTVDPKRDSTGHFVPAEPSDQAKGVFVRSIQSDAIDGALDVARFWLEALRVNGKDRMDLAERAAMQVLFTDRGREPAALRELASQLEGEK